MDDVSLSVNAGEIVGLLGENGAGKSTLVKIASGISQPDLGEISVGGQRVTFGSPSDAHRSGVSISPQELILCSDMTVADNVVLGAPPVRRSGFLDHRLAQAEARERLDWIGATHVPTDQKVGRLGVVDRAFVQLARAMSPGTKVLIADEPTAPMSGDEVDRVLRVLRTVAERGVGVVYVSHRLAEVFSIVNRAVVLRDGRCVAEMSSDEMTRDRLVRAMIGSKNSLVPPRPSTATTEPGLIIENLQSKQLHGFSATVHQGEIVAVYGIAGSGREDVGGCVVGAIPRTGGKVVVDGYTLPVGNIRRAIDHGTGYVPAERRTQGLLLTQSIRANLTLAILGRLQRFGLLAFRRERAIAEKWMTALQVSAPNIDVQVWTLSGGNQQKVLLSRWLAAESRVLVLEEPTRGIDVGTKAEMYRILRELADQGIAVLMVSSDLEEVVTVGDRIVVIRGGRNVAELSNATQEMVAEIALETVI